MNSTATFPWAGWLRLTALLALGIGVWRWHATPVPPARQQSAQAACLAAAMPARLGRYRTAGPRQMALMGGRDISALYTSLRRRRPIELTFGLGIRATHPWLQSYRIAGDQIRWRRTQRLQLLSGHTAWDVAVVDSPQRRWLVASMQCWQGHCEGDPLRLWLESWWRAATTPVMQITVLAGAAGRQRHPVIWYDNELTAFLRHFRLPPVVSCLARRVRP